MRQKFAIGLDYGTNSVRALVVDTADGEEVASAVWDYAHGDQGVILSRDPNLARQHPGDYLKGTQLAIRAALGNAREVVGRFSPNQIVGIGVDATGSTPLPVNRQGKPLAFDKRFQNNPAAMAWLWKDHTAIEEAAEITQLAHRLRPRYLAKCGGAYSSEWFFSKILHCRRAAPRVFRAAHRWLELADWLPAILTGNEDQGRACIGVCGAGHKAMFNETWGGYPDREFLGRVDPELGKLRERLNKTAWPSDHRAGGLSGEWAERTGLPPGIPVAAGALDAHMGAVGCGVQPGTLVKIVGTSSCDMTVWPTSRKLGDIPGLCGIVNGSILPGYWGLEAGQAAVGDIFNWLVNYIQPGGTKAGSHERLTKKAARLKPGETGLLALDWNNGNRNVLTDQRLTGLLIGQTLYTRPEEIYRALIEATAFGGLTIINRFEEYGVEIKQVIACGGIAEKSPLVMQLYADVTGRPIRLSRSSQTCALGAAIAGAVVAGIHKDFPRAQKSMTGQKSQIYKPDPQTHAVYRQLYALYQKVHDAFGKPNANGNLYDVMKRLIEIRNHALRKTDSKPA